MSSSFLFRSIPFDVNGVVQNVPEKFNVYFEPFLGSGDLFFALKPEKAVLSDIDTTLLAVYKLVKYEPKKLSDVLNSFSPTIINQPGIFVSDLDRAAYYIFQNRCGPISLECLLDCSEALQKASIDFGSFSGVIDVVQPGDFVFFDPPFVPSGIVSKHTLFSVQGFNSDSNKLLSKICDELNDMGVYWIQINSTAPLVYSMYQKYNIKQNTHSTILIKNF